MIDPFLLFAKSGGLSIACIRIQKELLDFEALTPNLLARTIETVEGGGLIILLLHSLTSLTSLYTMAMDVHERFRTESHSEVTGRFNERFLLSVASCKACLIMDDELNVIFHGKETGDQLNGLSILSHNRMSKTGIVRKLSDLTKSIQGKCPVISNKSVHFGTGIPNVRWFGVEGDYSVLVMDLLGPSLEDLFNFCSGKISLKTVLRLADQMINRVEFVHTKSFLHRDIKPDNFLMGLGRRTNQIIGSICAVSAGLDLGKEGPLVHIGSCIASLLGQGGPNKHRLKWCWLRYFNNDRDCRDLITCGAVSGVCAAFRSPIGGVLFALEEVATWWRRPAM
ncbi:hypothetical protein IFM89_001294 [Coptis chinensis]|uniref:Protein kinase domain-containing protein n=1 Tax=Coptis chinensis TaxID=261450 RepID=A0A835ITJ2_9MAGN|nr:hypothetical protein IFM89_001294 [Coptis chinensis]